jgi:XTP/dITP diphosphohydrolase
MKHIVFVTSNKGKVAEATALLASLGYTVEQKDLGYPEIQVDSLQEVALNGAENIRQRLHSAFFLEDSGIFITSLAGFPGVYSKYAYLTIGLPGILKLLEGKTDRSAIFRSVIAYTQPGHDPELLVGECPGTIALEQRGTGGFGYDPIFIPNGWSQTFAEVTPQVKNTVSHRGRAMDLLVQRLSR